MKEFPSILITGGAGSFGRALATFLLSNNMVSRLCVLSRGEIAQANMARDLENDSRLRFFIGDVRDEDRLARAMTGVDMVIHAAALKRIEVGHYNPDEMVKTNVMGAINVISAARRTGVDRVVALSTDKAFQPVSAYGQSKALMESLMIAANDTSGVKGPRFVVTRYGNIWASSSSVVPIWVALAEAGKVIPITDPACTRFFMKMAEAIELVIGAAVDPDPGNIAVPHLPAYSLTDLATAFGAVFGGKITFKVTGLPEHEKRHESMRCGESSATVKRMSVDELIGHIRHYMESRRGA